MYAVDPDHLPHSSDDEGQEWGGDSTSRGVTRKGRLLGGEANMWAEQVFREREGGGDGI